MKKTREISTLVAVFCPNASTNTRKTKNNHKVHAKKQKQKKKIQKMSSVYSKMSFRKKLLNLNF